MSNNPVSTEESIQNKNYTTPEELFADDRVRTLNSGDTFVVFDRWGDIPDSEKLVQGLFHNDTRFLSRFTFRLFDQQPFLLHSSIAEENDILNIDLTNKDIYLDGKLLVANSKVHIERLMFLQNGICHKKMKLYNHSKWPIDLKLTFEADADFKDVFELRGYSRSKRGELIDPNTHNGDGKLHFGYKGLDDVTRETVIGFDPQPDSQTENHVTYYIRLESRQDYTIESSIKCITGGQKIKNIGFDNAFSQLSTEQKSAKECMASIHSSNENFNHWVNRSQTDLVSLTNITAYGKYPYAGVPWFNAAFGRDAIITAYESLWACPDIARGVLSYLCDKQAGHSDSFQDAEPGKIVHEVRGGEMAELREVAYKQYYGTVDATPLFIVLAGAYYKRTADLDFIRAIWPNIEAALEWIDVYGDSDNDGFVEYHHKSETGLFNQGWKDADNAIHHADGRLAESPIALCEVQGYVYDAKIKAAELAGVLRLNKTERLLREEAILLKERFNQVFWDDELNTFVLALDKYKQPCRVKTSNAGQCLFSGIVKEEYARILADSIMRDDIKTGWGIRTLASDAARYNPMSYHNGTIWPHDNALIAHGLAKYGFREEVLEIMSGLHDASIFIDFHRLPELYCGFERREGQGPVPYPDACSPQAWAVAAVYMLVQSCLNLEINAIEKKVFMKRPILPSFISSLEIKHVPLENTSLSLKLYQNETDVGIDVREKAKEWEVVVVK